MAEGLAARDQSNKSAIMVDSTIQSGQDPRPAPPIHFKADKVTVKQRAFPRQDALGGFGQGLAGQSWAQKAGPLIPTNPLVSLSRHGIERGPGRLGHMNVGERVAVTQQPRARARGAVAAAAVTNSSSLAVAVAATAFPKFTRSSTMNTTRADPARCVLRAICS
eukprot:CAMPEP_0118981482 /NCGR_PEP_ID=MMETSP1173-20130426/30659_1 /TAXON_ID=1034831 /ORGANISM="Rhizochromulina marina cf, Strain CCMP1243" /LENGTH=163 /DNA_ID=CAMNT_0006931901 /DNA_START=602 /DNA_END=1090 /DNA_ORIENTATION=-